MKPEQTARGQWMSLCELAGAEVCAAAGVPTPAVALLRIPEESIDLSQLDDLEDRRAAEELMTASRGRLAFCSHRLETAVDAEAIVLGRPRRRPLLRSVGLSMLLVDALIRNADRRLTNPNALLWQGELVAIDHGHAFDGLDRATDPRVYARSMSPAFNPHEHLLIGSLRRLAEKETLDPTPFLRVQTLSARLAEVAAGWPSELDVEGQRYKTLITEFLAERLGRLPKIVDSVLQVLQQR